MREIKIRYIFRTRWTKKVRATFRTIDELENGGFFLGWGYKLLSKNEFTGAYDKDGKEIYAEDVVKADVIGLVSWDEKLLQYTIFWSDKVSCSLVSMKDCIEVIGNFAENPGLLKEFA